MKILFVITTLLLSLNSPSNSDLPSTAHKEIKEQVADHFEISEDDVALQSPNTVYVTIGSALQTGYATFESCGRNCTDVTIEFPSGTLLCSIGDDMDGI